MCGEHVSFLFFFSPSSASAVISKPLLVPGTPSDPLLQGLFLMVPPMHCLSVVLADKYPPDTWLAGSKAFRWVLTKDRYLPAELHQRPKCPLPG